MPKTAAQEKLEGYPGHRPANKSMPVPDQEIPPPPRWMGPISTRAYHDLVRVVGPEGMRVMAGSDRLALVMVCEAFEEWRRCRDMIQAEGRYFESGKVVIGDKGEAMVSNRQIKRHPAVGDMQNAWNRIMTGLGKFGLTPFERQKVSAISESKREKTREETMAENRKKALEAAKKKSHIKAVGE